MSKTSEQEWKSKKEFATFIHDLDIKKMEREYELKNQFEDKNLQRDLIRIRENNKHSLASSPYNETHTG